MFRKLTLLALILAFCVIVLGSYVRLSDAGLGCPDWPGCYGQAVLKDSEHFRQQALQAFPGHPLDFAKAWKEMTHRYLAAALGVVVLLLSLLAWWQKHCRKAALTSSIVLLVLVGLQAALGMWTVTLKTLPAVVTAHLLLGLFTFWMLFWIFLRVKVGVGRRTKPSGPAGLAAFTMFLLLLQVFLGGWVSSNYASLACTGFPLCNGQWWPQVDYWPALDVLRGFFTDYPVLPYESRVAIHWLHRVGALLVLLMTLVLVSFSVSSKNPKPVRRGAGLLLLLVFIQTTSGALNILLGLPLWNAVAHNGLAALLMLPLIYIRFYSRYELLEVLKLPEVTEQTPETPAPQQKDSADSWALEPVDQIDTSMVSTEAVIEEAYVEKPPEALFSRLQKQLKKTRSGLGHVLARVSLGQKKIDDELVEEIETSLIMADVGVDATRDIIAHLHENVERNQLSDAKALTTALKKHLVAILQPCDKPLLIPEQAGPFVILVVGVNGVGKTTTIGKMAKRLQAQGHSVMLAAGDTFRAAAVEQLQTWGERNNIHVVAQHTGADSASVIYDGIQSAQAKGIDVLIADTAGRLHTKSNLMEELKKVKRIMAKLDPDAPHEVLLILDAGTGQNALMQAEQFNSTVELTGIALTKLDGTAKGGVIFALAKRFGVPIRYIGIGEGIDDLQDFHAEQFVEALFSSE